MIITGVSHSRLGVGVWNLLVLKCELRKFPGGGPVVGTQHFCWGGLGSIPGWGTKILQAEQWSPKKKNNQKTALTLKKKNELSQLLVMGRISLTLRQERRLALNTDSLQLASS